MSMTTKEQVIRTIESLPDEVKLEEVIERLYLLYRIERAEAQADEGRLVSHEDARKRLQQWLK